ncbi:MAG: glyceraldehyde-3-phosphate dehydrogenase [Pseudomonadota bacterium]
MTNRIAFYIGGGIVVILVLDYALGLGIGLFLARRLLDLMNLIAVWR